MRKFMTCFCYRIMILCVGHSLSAATFELVGTLRNFNVTYPDLQYKFGTAPEIVELMLCPDRKPVYAGQPRTSTTNGANFSTNGIVMLPTSISL